MDGHSMNTTNTGNQHQGGGNSGTGGTSGGTGTGTGTRPNPMDLRMDLSNLTNTGTDMGGGMAGMAGTGTSTGMPSPRVAASGLRRSSHNSSPAIFSGSSSMRRTMSGSKRSAPNEDFGGGGGGGGGGLGMAGHRSSRNVHRTRPSMMSRSSTFTASTSTNAVWEFNHPGGGGGSAGNANWGRGGGGSGVGLGSGGMRGGGGEEASYQQSVGRSMNHLGGGRNPGSNPFLQGGGGSGTDMAQLLNEQNLLQQTAPSAGGSGGSGSGMGGAGLVFDPRRGTVGLAGAGGSSGNNNINSNGRRIPNPSGADFMSMMGLKRPGDGGFGGGGGSSNSSMAGGSSNSSLHSHQRPHSGAMEVPLNDTPRTGGHDHHQQQQGGSIQGVKMQKRGSAMLRRSSQNLTELQRFKMPEEEGADHLSEDGSIGNANFGGGGGGGGGVDETVLQHLQRAQQQHQPTATSTAMEIARRMQELRREQEKVQQAVSAKPGSSGADGSTSVQQEQGQAGDAGSQASVDAGLSNLSGLSDISASDMQMLFHEELGGTGPGGGSSAGGSAGSLGSGLAGFDFDQHAREVAAEVTDQVAAELMAGGGGGSDGSGGASRTGVVDGGSAAAAAAVAANTATVSGGEPEVDYGSLLAHFEPTPLSAQSEQLLHARRQSNMSMGSEHSGTSALASGISTMGGLGGVPPIPVADPSSTSSTPGLHQMQAQQQFQEQQFSSMGTSMGSAASTGVPASPAIPQMQQQAQFPQQVMQSPPVAAAATSATASMAVAPDQTNSSDPSAAAISVQSQLQHVAHGGAGAQQSVVSGLGVKGLDGPRDASWMVSAILQLSKVGPRVPDRDGLLPVHLACLYCPNEKKLVGNILIVNPESATFIVSPPPENVDVEGGNANPQDVIMSLTSNALAAARKKANPSVMMSQLQGSYPLHIVLRSFGGEKVTYEVVKLLALSGPGVLTTPDPFGCVPLSIGLQNKVGSQIIRYLLEQNKDSARVPDEDGNYPLHHACMSARGKKKYSLAIIKLLTQSYPKALAKKNKEGKKPLDLAYGPKGRDDYLNEGKTDSAIEFLEKTYEKLKRKQQEKIASKG